MTLLGDTDYPQMYNSAVGMSQQLQAIGINARLCVTDGPTSVQISNTQPYEWNSFTGWGTTAGQDLRGAGRESCPCDEKIAIRKG